MRTANEGYMEVINSAVFGAIAIGKQALEEIFGIMNGRQ